MMRTFQHSMTIFRILNCINQQNDPIKLMKIGKGENIIFSCIMAEIIPNIGKGGKMLQSNAIRKSILPDSAEDTCLIFFIQRGNNHSNMNMSFHRVTSRNICILYYNA